MSYVYCLIDKIVDYIDKYPNNNETNYLAVEFECLTALYYIIDKKEYQQKIEKCIELILIELQNRTNLNGLYKFKNGDVRLDITGHILNGFYNLLLILIK
jgi:hypothetical protein